MRTSIYLATYQLEDYLLETKQGQIIINCSVTIAGQTIHGCDDYPTETDEVDIVWESISFPEMPFNQTKHCAFDPGGFTEAERINIITAIQDQGARTEESASDDFEH